MGGGGGGGGAFGNVYALVGLSSVVLEPFRLGVGVGVVVHLFLHVTTLIN